MVLHLSAVCLTYVDNLVLLPFEKYHTKRITSHSLTLVWDLSYSCQTILSYFFCLTPFWKISYKLSSRKACKVRQSTRLTKKLMLSRVQVKRIKSDIPACNFNHNHLEIAGELASGARRRSNDRAWISSLSRRILSFLAVIFSTTPPFWHGGRALKAGETIPAILLEAENSRCSAGQNLGN